MSQNPSVPKTDVQRWQAALESDDGPHATIRHILMSLSCRMDRNTGDRAFPGMRELERRTGRTQRTLIDRLDEADRLGWVRRLALRGRRGKYRQYLPAIPGEVLKQVQRLELDLIRRGAEALSAPIAAEVASEGAVFDAEGAENPSPQVLKEIQQSSSRSSSKSHSGSRNRGRSEGRSEVEVPEGFDPAKHGLDDMAILFARMDSRAHGAAVRWAGFGGQVQQLSGSRDLDFLRPDDLRRLQFMVQQSGRRPQPSRSVAPPVRPSIRATVLAPLQAKHEVQSAPADTVSATAPGTTGTERALALASTPAFGARQGATNDP